jgi:hypothetical protein
MERTDITTTKHSYDKIAHQTGASIEDHFLLFIKNMLTKIIFQANRIVIVNRAKGLRVIVYFGSSETLFLEGLEFIFQPRGKSPKFLLPQ